MEQLSRFNSPPKLHLPLSFSVHLSHIYKNTSLLPVSSSPNKPPLALSQYQINGLQNHTFSAPIFLVILAMTGAAVAARDFPERLSSDDDKKQPQWLIAYDGVSVLIPGIGCITLSPYDKGSHGGGHSSSYGSNPAPRRQYIPGGDDNFIPNPGYEVPIPANIGGVKETSCP